MSSDSEPRKNAPQLGHWKSPYSTIVTGAAAFPRTGAVYAAATDASPAPEPKVSATSGRTRRNAATAAIARPLAMSRRFRRRDSCRRAAWTAFFRFILVRPYATVNEVDASVVPHDVLRVT